MFVPVIFEPVSHHDKDIILIRFGKDAALTDRLKQKFPKARGLSRIYDAGYLISGKLIFV
jgi:acetoin utilization deacetylase AcuC-like enzyme